MRTVGFSDTTQKNSFFSDSLVVVIWVVWCDILMWVLASYSCTQPAQFCWQKAWRGNNLVLYAEPPAPALHFAAGWGLKITYTNALALESVAKGPCCCCKDVSRVLLLFMQGMKPRRLLQALATTGTTDCPASKPLVAEHNRWITTKTDCFFH